MFSPKHTLCFDSRGLPYTGDAECEPHDAIITFARASKVDSVELSLGGTVVRRR